MAIPKANAKLSEMGADLNRSLPVSLRDIALSRRALDFDESGSVSTADLRGSITSAQEYMGKFNNDGNTDRCHRKDIQWVNLLENPQCSQNATNGYFTISFIFRPPSGGAANYVGVQVNYYGKLPSSGKFSVEVNHSKGHGNSGSSSGRRRIELVGSKTSWLQGGNYIYKYKDDRSNDPVLFNSVAIDPEYPYLTVTCYTYYGNANSSQSVRTEFGDVKAYLS